MRAGFWYWVVFYPRCKLISGGYKFPTNFCSNITKCVALSNCWPRNTRSTKDPSRYKKNDNSVAAMYICWGHQCPWFNRLVHCFNNTTCNLRKGSGANRIYICTFGFLLHFWRKIVKDRNLRHGACCVGDLNSANVYKIKACYCILTKRLI